MKAALYLILIGLISALPQIVAAQDYQLTVGSGIEQIIVRNGHGKFEIIGHAKKEILIKAAGIKTHSKGMGLKPLYSGGADTGIGLVVNETEKTIEITGVAREENQVYQLWVPHDVAFRAEWKNHDSQKLLKISDLKSSVEVHRINGEIEIANISGPLVLYSMHGDTKIRFSAVAQERPISITSYNADIEIEMPADTPANLTMSSGLGEIFAGFDIARSQPSSKPNDDRAINGTINGGGVEIILQSYGGNFYLRKY